MNNMGIIKSCCIALALYCTSSPGYANDDTKDLVPSEIQVSHLSNTHALIHVSTDRKYILLPVEENADIAHISIIKNGIDVQSINVRLAVNKIDYYVPFNISEYHGAPLLFSISLWGDRTRYIEDKYYICWKNIVYRDSFDTSNKEKFRPLIHHTPEYGWMNDPNGMFYENGMFHLYFQYNPYGSQWENMTWGHSVSKDLIHWEKLENAIMPDAIGTIFSGSCVVDQNNTAGFGKGAIVAIYTSAGENQTQSLAYSTDGGMTFTKYAGNPIITSDLKDFRDPKVFWNKQTSKWNLILAAGLEMRIYSSSNLKAWTYESSFGKEYGNHGGVWECPDLIELPVEGKKHTKWVLICNINPGGPFGGSATQYFTGTFDGHKFTCETKPGITKWADYGKDHYAAVTFSNAPSGRHIMMGWMSNWQYADNVPTKQYRSANTIARDLSLYEEDGNTYLKVLPSTEMLNARGNIILNKKDIDLYKNGMNRKMAVDNGAYEIVADIKPAKSGIINIELSNDKDEKVIMSYNLDTKTFTMNRAQSGDVSFSNDFNISTSVHFKDTNSIQLRIIVDKSSIEAFEGNGKFAMTNLVFPSSPYNTIKCSSTKSCTLHSLIIYNLK